MAQSRPVLQIVVPMALVVTACLGADAVETVATPQGDTTLGATTTLPSATTSTPATTPAPTATLVIKTVVNETGSGGSFTADGTAVDSGRFCAAGDFINRDFDFEADPNWFEDAYRCEGFDGALVLRVETPVPDEEDEGDSREPVAGTWTVVSASGVWEATMGSGDYLASFDPWVETYRGELEFVSLDSTP